jgi:hypothetical protein
LRAERDNPQTISENRIALAAPRPFDAVVAPAIAGINCASPLTAPASGTIAPASPQVK